MGIEEKFYKEFQTQIEEMVKPNLVIVGKTGAGKSSLIKSIFGVNCDTLKISTGKPCTRGMNPYEPENVPLIIFDTEGYELTSDGNIDNSNFKTNVVKKIDEMNRGTLKDHVHLVWYCISVSEHRVTEYDLDNINYFKSNNMKTAVIFTQCDNDEEESDGTGKIANEFKKVINKKFESIMCFETCATKIKELPLDMEKLIDWSVEALPNEQLRKSFIASQRYSLKAKRKIAYGIMATAAATTGTTAGLNPLPVSDSILIVPQQLAMAVGISEVFGFDSLGGNIGALLQSQLISIAGKQLAASLLKLIPGVGQAINAGVAASLTAGLGIALIEIYTKVYTDYLEYGKIPNWAELFTGDAFAQAIKEGMDLWKQKN